MAESPFHVTIVSHTHWDREWYQPFQVFRFRLVELIDYLLDLLDTDPTYRSFLLDGQTILLEDYLAIRPEREPDLRRHIAHGRLMIGPWHILPDEFLVSPESTVRNLMLGSKTCAQFGSRMSIGYTPDPFGHISQLPQILDGCGIKAIALQRGLADEPTELWWEAADGTRLLTIYFREGYGNLAWAPTTPDAFTRAVTRQIERLTPHAHTSHMLLMNGTDHMIPQPELPGLIAAANGLLEGQATLKHGTLVDHVEAVRASLDDIATIPVIQGELRSSKRFPILPGVYSARLWIKQRNHACEVSLERYAEPISAFVHTLGGSNRSGEIWRAWRYLVENHPHDSICGCSVDQVHAEMQTRFDWSQQLADQITDAGLRDLAARVDLGRLTNPSETLEIEQPDYATTAAQTNQIVLVYNPVTRSQTGQVEITVPWAGSRRRYQVLDKHGQDIPYRILEGEEIVFESCEITRNEADSLLDQIEIGLYKGRLISDVQLKFDGTNAHLEMVLPEYHTGRMGNFSTLIKSLRDDPRWYAAQHIHLTTYLADNFRLAFTAQAVPGVGYRTFRLTVTHPAFPDIAPVIPTHATVIENEWFHVEVDPQDGTLTVTDKSTGAVYRGLNRVQDGGDRGDEYNYCAPDKDTLVTYPAHPPAIERHEDELLGQALTIRTCYAIPADLTVNRDARTAQTVDVPITFTVRLAPQVRRIDVRAELKNSAPNHRIRVLFPTGLQSDRVIVDGHFDRLYRQGVHETAKQGWAEQPAPTAAQRAFTAIEGNENGLMVAARGLPEYEHLVSSTESTLALTLIRAVGWLSRDDLNCRPGHAGPARATPDAQCIGPATAEYSLIPFGNTFTLAQAAQEAYAFIAPLRGVTATPAGGLLPPTLQFVSLTPDELILTAVKPAESGRGIIVRFYNSQDCTVSGQLAFGLPVHKLTPVNLLEEPHEIAGKSNIKDNREVTFDIAPKQIVSLHVDLLGL
jgi:mannosylglycerate hydrolase